MDTINEDALRAVNRVALGFALCFAVAALAFVYAYANFGTAFVHGLDAALGEVHMREGLRLEAAGALEDAEYRYRQALAARFDDPNHQSLTLRHLGAVLLEKGEPAEAAEALWAAIDAPGTPLSAYELLARALFDLKRPAEFGVLYPRWRAAAESANDAGARALAENYAGRAALETGAPETARAHFEAGIALRPGGRNAYELAQWHYDAGNWAEAIRHAEAYLNEGSGPRAAYMTQVRDIAKRRLGPRAN